MIDTADSDLRELSLRLQHAHSLLAQGDVDAARVQFMRLVDRPMARVPALSGLPAAALQTGQFSVALDLAQQALGADRQHLPAHLVRARCFELLGEPKQAL